MFLSPNMIAWEMGFSDAILAATFISFGGHWSLTFGWSASPWRGEVPISWWNSVNKSPSLNLIFFRIYIIHQRPNTRNCCGSHENPLWSILRQDTRSWREKRRARRQCEGNRTTSVSTYDLLEEEYSRLHYLTTHIPYSDVVCESSLSVLHCPTWQI